MEKLTVDIKDLLFSLNYEMDEHIESLLKRIDERREVIEKQI